MLLVIMIQTFQMSSGEEEQKDLDAASIGFPLTKIFHKDN